MGIGESVVRQDQKIALCQTTVILILKGKHVWCKRKGSRGESAPDFMGFFHWKTIICRENIFCYVKKMLLCKRNLQHCGAHFTVAVLITDLKC